MTTATKPANKTKAYVDHPTTKTTRSESSQRTTAEPIKFILDFETRDVVGWLYKWNTGALVPMWKNGKCENVVYE